MFHNADANETRGRYVICRLFLTDLRIAPSSWRWTWNIPDDSFSKLQPFPEWSHRGVTAPWPAGPLSLRRALNHVRVGVPRLPSQQARWHVAEKWLRNLLFIWLSQLTKWCAWLLYLPGHLRHRPSGRPCWPVNIKKGWWRYAGI